MVTGAAALPAAGTTEEDAEEGRAVVEFLEEEVATARLVGVAFLFLGGDFDSSTHLGQLHLPSGTARRRRQLRW